MDDEEPLGREYLLHEEIGRGALAVVRRATSRFGGPPLAAKLLKPEYAEDRRVRELFLREEAALRDLEHPSIVGIRDVVVERGRLALLMDYVDGPNLRGYLADRGGSLPIAEAAWIGAQAAAALAVAHVQGVVHLDLKPENILVVRGTDPTLIRISDFGVAALLLDADRPVIGGTPGYMAPECCRAGRATAAADVYSLGVVLREMLAGDLPEAADDLVAAASAADPRQPPVGAGPGHPAAATPRTAADRRRVTRRVPAPRSPCRRVAAAAASTERSGTPGCVTAARRRPPDLRHHRRPEPARWRRGPLLTLAAGVVVAAVLAGITVNAAADQRDAANAALAIPPITARRRRRRPPTTRVQAAAGQQAADRPAGRPHPGHLRRACRQRRRNAGHLAARRRRDRVHL